MNTFSSEAIGVYVFLFLSFLIYHLSVDWFKNISNNKIPIMRFLNDTSASYNCPCQTCRVRNDCASHLWIIFDRSDNSAWTLRCDFDIRGSRVRIWSYRRRIDIFLLSKDTLSLTSIVTCVNVFHALIMNESHYYEDDSEDGLTRTL